MTDIWRWAGKHRRQDRRRYGRRWALCKFVRIWEKAGNAGLKTARGGKLLEAAIGVTLTQNSFCWASTSVRLDRQSCPRPEGSGFSSDDAHPRVGCLSGQSRCPRGVNLFGMRRVHRSDQINAERPANLLDSGSLTLNFRSKLIGRFFYMIRPVDVKRGSPRNASRRSHYRLNRLRSASKSRAAWEVKMTDPAIMKK